MCFGSWCVTGNWQTPSSVGSIRSAIGSWTFTVTKHGWSWNSTGQCMRVGKGRTKSVTPTSAASVTQSCASRTKIFIPIQSGFSKKSRPLILTLWRCRKRFVVIPGWMISFATGIHFPVVDYGYIETGDCGDLIKACGHVTCTEYVKFCWR